jgi:hypothetical protein
MTHEEFLRRSFVSLEVNEAFSEAVLRMRDDSRLHFCHRVDERWAKAVASDQPESGTALAGTVLATVARFRLNAKHLDVQFADGSRWEARFERGVKGS